MTVWSPDTCGCVITCDDKTGEPAAHLTKCSFHAATLTADIAVENRRKNGAVNEVEKQFPGLTGDGLPGKTFAWKMAADRTVEITITGITTAQRAALTTTLTTKFGTTVRVL